MNRRIVISLFLLLMLGLNPLIGQKISSNSTSASGGYYENYCYGKTFDQGTWGGQNGSILPLYLHANFAGAFPNGLTIGCTNKLVLTSATAVLNYLPSVGNSSLLPTGTWVNPPSSYNNTLAGELVALTLNVGLDNFDPNFSSSNFNFGNSIISGGTFNGMTVNSFLALGNSIIGGCSSNYSLNQIRSMANALNLNYYGGLWDFGNVNCCAVTAPTITANKSTTFCAGSQVTLTASGASSYTWSNGVVSSSVTVNNSGSFYVSGNSANGCTAVNSNTIIVSVTPNPTITHNVSNVLCNGGSTGSLQVNASGGNSPFTYSLNGAPNISSSNTFTGLIAGTYTISAKNAQGCLSSTVVNVGQPTLALSAQAAATSFSNSFNVSCFGGSNGTASVTAIGGTAPYTYSWTNGATTSTAGNLSAAQYTVTVTDAKGCVAKATVSLTQPSSISTSTLSSAVSCAPGQGNSSNGSATVTASGGTQNFNYSWTNSVGSPGTELEFAL